MEDNNNTQDSILGGGKYKGLSSPPPLEGQVDAFRTAGKLASIGNGTNLLSRADSNYDTARNFVVDGDGSGEGGGGGGPQGTPVDVTICQNGVPVTITILTA